MFFYNRLYDKIIYKKLNYFVCSSKGAILWV